MGPTTNGTGGLRRQAKGGEAPRGRTQSERAGGRRVRAGRIRGTTGGRSKLGKARKSRPIHAHGRVHRYRKKRGVSKQGPLLLRPSLIVTIEAVVMVCWEAHRASFGRPVETVDWPSRYCQYRQVKLFHLQEKLPRNAVSRQQPTKLTLPKYTPDAHQPLVSLYAAHHNTTDMQQCGESEI